MDLRDVFPVSYFYRIYAFTKFKIIIEIIIK